MTPREEVYRALDSERNYQQAKWGPTQTQGLHSITEFLVFIQDYTNEAMHIESRESVTTADAKALDNIRKIAAMCVACMEQHGAPKRDLPLNTELKDFNPFSQNG